MEEWLEEFCQQCNCVLEQDFEVIWGVFEVVCVIVVVIGGCIVCVFGVDLIKVKLQLGKVGLFDVFGVNVFSGQDLFCIKLYLDVYLVVVVVLGVDFMCCVVIEDIVIGVIVGVVVGVMVFGFSEGGLYYSMLEVLCVVGVCVIF